MTGSAPQAESKPRSFVSALGPDETITKFVQVDVAPQHQWSSQFSAFNTKNTGSARAALVKLMTKNGTVVDQPDSPNPVFDLSPSAFCTTKECGLQRYFLTVQIPMGLSPDGHGGFSRWHDATTRSPLLFD